LISVYKESFGIIHPEVDYVIVIGISCQGIRQHIVETFESMVALYQFVCWIPAERMTIDRNVELMHQFSMQYGGSSIKMIVSMVTVINGTA